ncbi:LysE family translocator [Polycladidibacter stylochi]|uniref:LysE family translocator n=1 Tax=Polycladidibacter stylochi TaxID=1807766 RepID=UPI0009EC029C|nr:LysE family translocator [Pseudovibrio stylochi]
MSFSSAILPMALFALATSASPGPVNVILAMSGARFGTLGSLPYVLGATTSFVAILLLLGFGVHSILALVEQFTIPLTLAGSLYMLYLAYKIAADNGKLALNSTDAKRVGFVSGFVTQALNPKAWIVSLSAITIYVAPHVDYNIRLLGFAIIFFVICSLSLTSWALIGAKLARMTGNLAAFNRVMAAVLVLAIVLILYDLL